ncbi:MAG: methylamine utilization protein [Burkholderiales bacterium]|nr:methylamine utilization protein [Burkholderiales bacterium]
MDAVNPDSRRARLPASVLASVVVAFSMAPLRQALAIDLIVAVRDQNRAPLENAIVYAIPASGKIPAQAPAPASIEQIGKRFTPLVSVAQTGAAISFPNKDTVRHHVYSFSPAKVFELKLYSGLPSMPVVFDKPGLVVLGCNIHDRMIAYVLVVETPWFVKTSKDGAARFTALPAGNYELKAWHYGLPGPDAAAAKMVSVTNSATEVNFQLPIDTGAKRIAPDVSTPERPD